MREGWRETRLGDVLSQHIAPISVEPEQSYTNLGVQWYTGGTFQREQKRGADMKATRLFKVRPGQFIYNRMFVTEGSFALVAEDHADGVVSNEFPVFDVNQAIMLPEYLLLHFQQAAVWASIAEEATGTTKSRRRWKESQFVEYRIMLPPLAEQHRVIELIAAIDKAIDTAEGEAVCALRFWQSSCDAAKNHANTVPYRVEELTVIARSGGTPSRANPANYGGGIPWLKSGDVRGRAISEGSELITDEGLSTSSAWIAPAGSILVAMYGGGTVGNVGRLAVPMSTNQAVLALVANEACISSELLFHFMASDSARLAAKAIGAAQANISKRIVLDHQVNVPPISDQVVLSAMLEAALGTVDTARATVEALRTLRNDLLTVLLSGEHEIPASYDQFLNLDEEAAA